ncbi:maleylpyruvate isomerase family mycothiol-dependent enzyme [Paeniglutamicibacter sp.]|uniref:maleylpyruvate isomerase family mycothiol-dependent enzyme n=1 Tax=Paeniglutamicibacter sp. TaxID=1934391 RepID=UPI003989B8D9
MSRKLHRDQLWNAAHVERAALAEDLATLEDSRWALPSLCGRWSVRETLAHLTAAASVGPVRWFASVLGARFDFDLHNDRRLAEQLGATPAETLARFRDIATSTTSTLGPTEAWLGEVVVHSEDIRRPLGIVRAFPVDVLTTVANFYARQDFTVDGKKAIAGLRLEATDGPFATGDGPFATGDGPMVTGTTIALTMAMAGRGAYCDELTGPGVETLRARCSAYGSHESEGDLEG